MADKIISDYALAGSIDPTADLLLLEQAGTNSYKSINRDVLLGVTGQPADTTSVQSFSNKTLGNTNIVTLLDTGFTLQDNSDPTKQAQFQLSGITTATTRTYTLPNASSTLADIATAQTFTNKTLTSPVINGGSITNSTISVDSISEYTSANGVTIDGLNIKDGKLNTNNSVVTANYTDSSVTPAKLFTGTGASWVWQSFTSTLTNITVGSGGTNTAKYIQIGKTVFYELEIVLGNSGFSIGSGVTFTLPVTSVAYISGHPIGRVAMRDASTGGIYQGQIGYNTTTVADIQVWGSAGTYVDTTAISSTAPMTWAAGDNFLITGFYEAA